MNFNNLKELVEDDDYIVYFKAHNQEVIKVDKCIDNDGRILLTILSSALGINVETTEIVLPETLESYLFVYKALDSSEVADLLGGDETCSCCEKGTNTVSACSCGENVCQNCEGVHTHDPDHHCCHDVPLHNCHGFPSKHPF